MRLFGSERIATVMDKLGAEEGEVIEHRMVTRSIERAQKKVEARLNVDHLRKLSQVAGVPLVLHGGSSVQRESVLAAIQEGITKINIGMDVRQPYERAIAEGLGVEAAQEAVACRIEQLVRDTYGINGTAAKLSAE